MGTDVKGVGGPAAQFSASYEVILGRLYSMSLDALNSANCTPSPLVGRSASHSRNNSFSGEFKLFNFPIVIEDAFHVPSSMDQRNANSSVTPSSPHPQIRGGQAAEQSVPHQPICDIHSNMALDIGSSAMWNHAARPTGQFVAYHQPQQQQQQTAGLDPVIDVDFIEVVLSQLLGEAQGGAVSASPVPPLGFNVSGIAPLVTPASAPVAGNVRLVQSPRVSSYPHTAVPLSSALSTSSMAYETGSCGHFSPRAAAAAIHSSAAAPSTGAVGFTDYGAVNGPSTFAAHDGQVISTPRMSAIAGATATSPPPLPVVSSAPAIQISAPASVQQERKRSRKTSATTAASNRARARSWPIPGLSGTPQPGRVGPSQQQQYRRQHDGPNPQPAPEEARNISSPVEFDGRITAVDSAGRLAYCPTPLPAQLSPPASLLDLQQHPTQHSAAALAGQYHEASSSAQTSRAPSSSERAAAQQQHQQQHTAAAPSNSAERVCSNCGERSTQRWRRNQAGQLVCNACGIYERVNNMPRPMRVTLRKKFTRGPGKKDGSAAAKDSK